MYIIYMCMNGNGADNSNDDANNSHHADVYIYMCVCIYSYIHCYSGVYRDHCSALWLYTKCCDVQNHRHGNPKLSPGDVITHRKKQWNNHHKLGVGTSKWKRDWKPFFTMRFLIIHSSWWREALTNLHGIHCEAMFQGPRNWGFEANYPNHLSLTNLRQNGIVGLCVKVVNFFKISRYGRSRTIFITEQNPSKSNLFFGSNHFEFNWAAPKKGQIL